jgi:hypothetical protein
LKEENFLNSNQLEYWLSIEEEWLEKEGIVENRVVVQWIPTIENILEDALIMIGLIICIKR